MHITYQVYEFINIINLSIQIYLYKTELDLTCRCFEQTPASKFVIVAR